MTLTSDQAVARQDTCPDGGDWKKVEWQENWNKKTYDADAGKTITDVCVKGGNLIKFFTNDGTQVCWKVDFKNSRTKVEISESNCGGNQKPDISHISYKQQSSTSPTATPTTAPTSVPTVAPTSTPIVTPSNTPVPTEGPQCKVEHAECELNNSQMECCEGLVCVEKDGPAKNWKCEKPVSSPTPTPTKVVENPSPTPTGINGQPTPTPTSVTEQPTPTPTSITVQPTPTPTEEPEEDEEEGKKSRLKASASCDSDYVKASMKLTDDGEGVENVWVTFNYNGLERRAESASDGYAIAYYNWDGENKLKARADGFKDQELTVDLPDCPAVGGTVLGASTTTVSSGEVLGFADTGLFADFSAIFSGVLGLAAMARARKFAK